MSDLWFNWNNSQDCKTSRQTFSWGTFHDETLRDGIQAPNIRIPTLEQKLQLVDYMVGSGISSADLGFPGSSAAAAKECLEISKYIKENDYPLSQGYAGRTHSADISAICEIAHKSGVPVDAYIFIGVSPLRQYVEDWSVESIVRNIRTSWKACQREGVEFVLVLEDTVRCTPEILSQVYGVALDIGVQRITLCDTVGAALPQGTEALVGWSTKFFADRGHQVALEWHGHNDRGLALINSITALESGCKRVHGTILGIGERAGNASIDQLMLNNYLDGHGSYDLKSLRKYCEYASTVLEFKIPQNYPAMGRDVFQTSAGVHASAILKAHEMQNTVLMDSVYSSIPASLLGREQEVLIDPSSGASNVKYWSAMHKREINASLIQKILNTATIIGRPLGDDEIDRIIATDEKY